MRMVVVAVRDSAAGAYARPFAVQSTGLAIRSFQDEVNRSDQANPMFNHPEHFELFEVGSFDEESGLVSGLPVPRSLATAESVKER